MDVAEHAPNERVAAHSMGNESLIQVCGLECMARLHKLERNASLSLSCR